MALEAVAAVDEIALRLPRLRLYLTDQLMRAGLSIVLNLREGAAEYSPAEKSRFYRIAYRSIAECEGGIDVGERLRLVPGMELREARSRLAHLGVRVHNLIKRDLPARPDH